MDSVSIWAGRPNGVDPTTHFWFSPFETGLTYRMCDGVEWAEEHAADDGPIPFVPCSLCKETYLTDVLHGRKALTISFEGPPPDLYGATPAEMGAVPIDQAPYFAKNGTYYPERTGGVMPVQRVSVFNFAKFCEARPGRQESVVRQIRKMSLDPRSGFDYYGPLKSLVRRTHWATNDVGTLEGALPSFLSGQRNPGVADNYRHMAEAYIDYWKSTASDYVSAPVSSPDYSIEGLTVRVNPEVGMRTRSGDLQILKLWFNRTNPTRQARMIIGHLMGKVNPNAQWHTGIWDIRQRNVPLPVVPPDGFDLVLAGQAVAFQRIWDGLDQEAERELD